jgi:hypothetical protein
LTPVDPRGEISYHRKITATVQIPHRDPPESVIVRLRHPRSAPIKSVMVNGKEWSVFDRARETIEITRPVGTVTVVARY